MSWPIETIHHVQKKGVQMPPLKALNVKTTFDSCLPHPFSEMEVRNVLALSGHSIMCKRKQLRNAAENLCCYISKYKDDI